MLKKVKEDNQKQNKAQNEPSNGLNYKIAVPLAILAGGFGSLYVYFHRNRGENNPLNKISGISYIKAVIDTGLNTVKNACGKVGDAFYKLNPWSKVVETGGDAAKALGRAGADSLTRAAVDTAAKINLGGAGFEGNIGDAVAGLDNFGDGGSSSSALASLTAVAAAIARSGSFSQQETKENDDAAPELEKPAVSDHDDVDRTILSSEENIMGTVDGTILLNGAIILGTQLFSGTDEVTSHKSGRGNNEEDEVTAHESEDEGIDHEEGELSAHENDAERSDHEEGELTAHESDDERSDHEEGEVSAHEENDSEVSSHEGEESDNLVSDLLLQSVFHTPQREIATNPDNSEEEVLTPSPSEALILYVEPKDQPLASVLGITSENE